MTTSTANAYPFRPASRITRSRAAIYSTRLCHAVEDDYWALIFRYQHGYVVWRYQAGHYRDEWHFVDLKSARAWARVWAGVTTDGTR